MLFALWTLFSALSGVLSKRNYTGSDNKASLFFMISCDLQLLIGLILYFNGVWFESLKDHAKEVMKNENGFSRFFSMEHAVMMIIAWLLVHMGRSMVKRTSIDTVKHKRSLIYFGIAILIILLMIPWPFRTEIARPWFRAF